MSYYTESEKVVCTRFNIEPPFVENEKSHTNLVRVTNWQGAEVNFNT